MSWPIVKLGDLFKVTSGGTPSRSVPEYYENGDIPWIKTGDLHHRYIEHASEYITSAGLNASSTRLYPAGTVLVAMYGATIGACSILKIPACTNQACAAFTPVEKVDTDYLYYFLKHSKPVFVNAGAGGAQPNISAGFLKNFEIPLPPLAEQKRIAAILDKADAIRRKRQQAIQLADDFLRAVFLEMFGDPVTNPKGWEVAGFQYYCELNPKSQKLNDDLEVSFVPMQKVSEQSPVVDVTDTRTFAEVKKGFTAFAEGDVLFAKITPCMENGKAGIARNLLNGFGYGSTEFHVLRPFKPHYAQFLYSLVHLEVFRKHAANSFSGAVGHKRVPKDFFEKFALYKIPEELVLKFSQIFTETYKSISSCSSSLLELDDLFNSLSQKAFSGQL